MKRYKRIVPSVLAFSMSLSSISTSDVFATTKTDFSDTNLDMDNNGTADGVAVEELTTGSAIEIAPLPTETTETTGVLTNANINTRSLNTAVFDGWTFEYDDTLDTAKITATIHKDGVVVIPETVEVDGNTYTVTSLGDKLFEYATDLTSVSIPESVTDIGIGAFYMCSSLTDINIPRKIKSIEDSTFAYCSSLTNVTLPPNLESIGYHAFNNCTYLDGIVIPDSVTYIGDHAFQYCSFLNEIVIPDGITTIENSTFANCYSLYTVTLPEGLTSIGNYAFQDCPNLTNIEIPGSVDFIGDAAFYRCSSLREIVIPDGVSSIHNRTFAECSSLTEIVIPNSVTSIDYDAFKECRQLTTITLPEGLTFIGNRAFGSCNSLIEVILPSNLEAVPQYLFGASGTVCITIPKTVGSIHPEFLNDNVVAFSGIHTPEFRDKNEQPGYGIALEFYVVNSETTSPFDGELVSIENNSLDTGVDNFLYAKYEITPDINLDGGKMNGRETFPAWATAETLTDYLGEPTKTGWDFAGWEVVQAKTITKGDVEYLIGPADNAKQLKLKAIWTEKSAVLKDVTFDANGGIFDANGDTPTTTTVIEQTEGEYYKLPVQPTRDDFTFLGWFDSSNNQITDTTVVTDLVDGIILTALWEENLDIEAPTEDPIVKDVTFDANGGIFDANGDTPTMTTVIEQTEGENYKLPVQPTRDDFTFLGWFDSSNNQITDTTTVTDLIDGIILKAKWEADNTDGGSTDGGDTDGGNTDGGDTDGGDTDGGNTDGGDTDGGNTDGGNTDGGNTDGGNTDGGDTDGGNTDGGNTDGGNTDGGSTDGGNTDGGNTDGGNTDGGNTDDSNSDDSNSDDSNSDDSNNDGSNKDGINIDGSNKDGINIDGSNKDGSNNAGSNNAGSNNDGSDITIGRPVSPEDLLFNEFVVKDGSEVIITNLSDGTFIRRTYAYNAAYIDPATNSMYVSLRGVLDNAIDTVELKWYDDTQTAEATFTDKGINIIFTANSSIMTVNGVERQMFSGEGDIVESHYVNGRLMIPLRFVSELFNFRVDYDTPTRTSTVYKNGSKDLN